MKYVILSILCFNLVSIGCKHKADYKDLLLNQIRKVDTSIIMNGYYLVIPNAGCTGCISEAEMLLRSGKKPMKPAAAIFTRIGSLKMLKASLLDGEISMRYLFDVNNVIEYESNDLEIYPVLIEIKSGKVNAIQY